MAAGPSTERPPSQPARLPCNPRPHALRQQHASMCQDPTNRQRHQLPRRTNTAQHDTAPTASYAAEAPRIGQCPGTPPPPHLLFSQILPPEAPTASRKDHHRKPGTVARLQFPAGKWGRLKGYHRRVRKHSVKAHPQALDRNGHKNPSTVDTSPSPCRLLPKRRQGRTPTCRSPTISAASF
jgi:hypothetical protein